MPIADSRSKKKSQHSPFDHESADEGGFAEDTEQLWLLCTFDIW